MNQDIQISINEAIDIASDKSFDAMIANTSTKRRLHHDDSVEEILAKLEGHSAATKNFVNLVSIDKELSSKHLSHSNNKFVIKAEDLLVDDEYMEDSLYAFQGDYKGTHWNELFEFFLTELEGFLGYSKGYERAGIAEVFADASVQTDDIETGMLNQSILFEGIDREGLTSYIELIEEFREYIKTRPYKLIGFGFGCITRQEFLRAVVSASIKRTPIDFGVQSDHVQLVAEAIDNFDLTHGLGLSLAEILVGISEYLEIKQQIKSLTTAQLNQLLPKLGLKQVPDLAVDEVKSVYNSISRYALDYGTYIRAKQHIEQGKNLVGESKYE